MCQPISFPFFYGVLPALAVFLGLVPVTMAAVIHTDLAAQPLAIPATLDGIYVNFLTGGFSTSAVPLVGWDFNFYHNGTGLAFFAPDFPSGQGTLISGSTALALLGGESLGGSSLFHAGPTLAPDFYGTGIRYAGLSFLNESTHQLNYGWAKLRTTDNKGFPAYLLGYAYENTGTAVVVGAIPEPSAVGLLGFSGMALLGWIRLVRCREASQPLSCG